MRQAARSFSFIQVPRGRCGAAKHKARRRRPRQLCGAHRVWWRSRNPPNTRKSMARPTRELAKSLYCVAFLAAGLLLVRSGALPLWLFAVAVVVVAGARVLSHL